MLWSAMMVQSGTCWGISFNLIMVASDLSLFAETTLSQEAQANATLNFRMHLHATLATHHVLEKHHLTQEAFAWVVGEIESKFHQSVVYPG